MNRPPARPPPRRPMFSTSRRPLSHPLQPQSTHTSSATSSSTRHTHDPATDLVERDSAGNPLVNAPVTGGKLTVHSARSELEDEVEQENQMIALFSSKSHHWDQAGKCGRHGAYERGSDGRKTCACADGTVAILEEIKVALQASCERKVQSLEGDRWMFEGEGRSKG